MTQSSTSSDVLAHSLNYRELSVKIERMLENGELGEGLESFIGTDNFVVERWEANESQSAQQTRCGSNDSQKELPAHGRYEEAGQQGLTINEMLKCHTLLETDWKLPRREPRSGKDGRHFVRGLLGQLVRRGAGKDDTVWHLRTSVLSSQGKRRCTGLRTWWLCLQSQQCRMWGSVG
jgi:hypothetical protein